MKSKTMIAGAIAAVLIICIMAAAAYSVATQGQAKPQGDMCKVNGYVVESSGTKLAGENVTLYVMGADQELYNVTTKTSGQPDIGGFVFDNVAIPAGTDYAYVQSVVHTTDGIDYLARSDKFAMQAGGNVSVSPLVMKIPPELTAL